MTDATSASSQAAYTADVTVGSSAVRFDLLTIAAIGVVAYAIDTIVHEAIGHGGACVLVGCKPQLVTSMQFDGDETELAVNARRFIEAGGSLANLIAAGLTIAVMPFVKRRFGVQTTWYFCWLFATLNLLHPTGYLLYSGVAGIGDWTVVVAGLEPAWLWRIALAAIGGASYYTVTRWSMKRLGRHLSRDVKKRVREANRYAVTAYIAGGALSLLAGFREPGGAFIVVISGAAASLGGTSALAWGPQLLHNRALAPASDEALNIGFRWRWIVSGAVIGIAYVIGLGGGLRL